MDYKDRDDVKTLYLKEVVKKAYEFAETLDEDSQTKFIEFVRSILHYVCTSDNQILDAMRILNKTFYAKSMDEFEAAFVEESSEGEELEREDRLE
jgi:hypothetical protein